MVSAITCTGRPRQWGQGSVSKDPGPVVRKEYYPNYDVTRRLMFDPRPSDEQRSFMTDEEVNDFVRELQLAEEDESPQAWQDILPITYSDFKLDDDDVDVLIDQCFQFYENLKSRAKEDPHLILGTQGQVSKVKFVVYSV